MLHPNCVAGAGTVRRFTSCSRRTAGWHYFCVCPALHDKDDVRKQFLLPSPARGWPRRQLQEHAWFASLTVPWWIAGGWALDLFAGDQSRPHKDLDVGILRNDALHVLDPWRHGKCSRQKTVC